MRTVNTLAGAIAHLLLLAAPPLMAAGAARLFTDPAAMLFLLVATLFYLVETSTARNNARPKYRSPQREPRKTYTLAALCGGLLLALFWAALLERVLGGDAALTALQWLGALLLGGGIVLRGAALARLGDQFRTECVVTDDQRLVMTGIYAWLQHPSEAGLLLIAAGASLLLLSIAAALLLLPLALLVLVRIHHEERHLLAAFGAQYLQYRRRVQRLAPRVF